MSLTKADIVESIHKQCGCSRNRSAELLKTALEIIKKKLSSGEEVLISGFGKFCVRERGRRSAIFPVAGNDSVPGVRRAATFLCSPVLRKKLNAKRRGVPGGRVPQ